MTCLSYDALGEMIEAAAYSVSPLPSLFRAAAYVGVAYVVGMITSLEAEELLLCIQVYAGV